MQANQEPVVIKSVPTFGNNCLAEQDQGKKLDAAGEK